MGEATTHKKKASKRSGDNCFNRLISKKPILEKVRTLVLYEAGKKLKEQKKP